MLKKQLNKIEIEIIQKYVDLGYEYAGKDRLGDVTVFKHRPIRSSTIWVSAEERENEWADMSFHESDDMIHLDWEGDCLNMRQYLENYQKEDNI